jgi:hypothetical protein
METGLKQRMNVAFHNYKKCTLCFNENNLKKSESKVMGENGCKVFYPAPLGQTFIE